MLAFVWSLSGWAAARVASLPKAMRLDDSASRGVTARGIVVQSREGGDFNAIDPVIFLDDDGRLWLAFGSQWSGLKLVELDPKSGKRLDPDAPLIVLAASEAADIHQRDGYYYLFLNWGDCCRGDRSTYNIRVGRSENINGPYIAKDGIPMLEGGGTLVLDVKKGPLTGPGHAGIIENAGKSWFSCHFEADDRMGGKATLGVMPIRWSADGRTEVEPPPRRSPPLSLPAFRGWDAFPPANTAGRPVR